MEDGKNKSVTSLARSKKRHYSFSLGILNWLLGEAILHTLRTLKKPCGKAQVERKEGL